MVYFIEDGLTEIRGSFVHMHGTDNTIIKQNRIESSLVNSDICISELIGR